MTSIPSTQSDWLTQAVEWAVTALQRVGRACSQPVEAAHIRPWSAIYRIVGDEQAWYLKAVTPTLRHEAALTSALARWQPHIMPEIVAANPERGWFVMGEGGLRLREALMAAPDLQRWHELLTLYGRLQVDLVARADELLALGVPDRRLPALPAAFADLLAQERLLGIGQPQGLAMPEVRRLRALQSRIEALCERLESYPVPASLDHGDLHDGNVFVAGDGYRLFDWGDASITHPFFSLRAAFVSIEHRFGLEEEAAPFDELSESYLAAWQDYDTPVRLVEALALAQKLAPLAAALRWAAALSPIAGPIPAEYAHAIPALLRELEQGLMAVRPPRVALGSEVDVELIDVQGARERLRLHLVEDTAADFAQGFLGASTPLAQTLLGQTPGAVLAYMRGDIRSVRIIGVRTSGALPPDDASARRRLALAKARAAVERTNAEMFAASFSGKWGDYDTEHMTLPGEDPQV